MTNLGARFEAAFWGWRVAAFLLIGLLGGLQTMAPPLLGTTVMIGVALSVQSRTSRSRRAFGQLWWIGVGYFAASLSWITAPFQVDAAVHGWMAPFALALMAGGAACFWGAAGWLAWRFAPGSALMLVLTLTGAEVVRSLVLSGFPWALLGHEMIATPFAQLAAIGGPHLLTLLVVGLPWAIGFAGRMVAVPVLVVGAILAFWGAGHVIPGAADDAPVVRLVQPNAPQDEKWDIDKREVFFDRMLSYSTADPRPDLIVWPESAVPQLMPYAQPRLERMAQAAQGVPVITGINRFTGDAYHNSLLVLDATGHVSAQYDKQHLVPFGEFIPMGGLLASAGIVPLNEVAGFSPGQDQALIELPGIGKARALICYEGIFAEEIATHERPRLMVLITNDAWFGGGLGPRQHLAQARLRAIEQGLPMVRVANTGISAMIDARGQITGQIALNTAGFLDVSLPPALPVTLYARFGDWPLCVILLFMTIGVATRERHLCD